MKLFCRKCSWRSTPTPTTTANPHRRLLKALEDKAPVRRGAAAEALGLGPIGANLPAVEKLLKDDQPAVRLQTALALAGGAGDREAVPVLIELINQAGGDVSSAAEDYLLRTAAEHGPADLPAGDASRGKRRNLWAAWWKQNGDHVTLAERYARRPASSAISATRCSSSQTIAT